MMCDVNESEMAKFFDDLEIGKRSIKYSGNKDVVLILGNVGSRKSIFTQFITNNPNLKTEKLKEGSFIIVNKNDKIRSKSQTSFPVLALEPTSNTAIYDFPEFSKTENQDFSRTYFMKKIIEFANSVKIVFTTPYSSDTKAIDKQDLALLIEYAVTLLYNIEKFEDSVALVVTDVDTNQDEKIIENIVRGLQDFKNEYSRAKENLEFNKKAAQFINILLEKEDNKYTRVGIFKKPQNAKALQKNKELQKNKKRLVKLVTENIKYSQPDENDLKFRLYAQSEGSLQCFLERMYNNIALAIENISEDVKKYYQNQENIINDIESLRQIHSEGYDKLSNTKTALTKMSNTQDFIELLLQSMKDLHISISNSNLQRIGNNFDYLNFMEIIQNRRIEPKLDEWANKLNNAVDHLKNSENWYDFLIKLNDVLSNYYVHKIYKQTYIVTQFLSQMKDREITIDDLIQFTESVSSENLEPYYNDIKDVKLDKFKISFLKEILNLTLRENAQISCVDDQMTIRGHYVKFADVDRWITELNCTKAKIIKIFALNTVFIDSDFNKTGAQMQLTIMAPKWDVINKPKLVLDGAPATVSLLSKAEDGQSSGSLLERSGKDGKPGNPGGSSGRFIGIAKTVVNGKALSIYVNGGKGGPGQNGGNGKKGADGTEPDYSGIEYECELQGKDCADGGNGGDGGAGGAGGHAEKVILIPLENTSGIQLYNVPGERGIVGKGGISGGPGRSGVIVRIEKDEQIITGNFRTQFKPTTYGAWKEDMKTCSWGKSGANGKNSKGLEVPLPTVMEAPANIIDDYKNYVRENFPNIRENFLREFIDQLEGNDSTEDLYDTLAYIQELQDLDERFYASSNRAKFLPFYQSLLNRIKHYGNTLLNNKKSDEDHRDDMIALFYASTAIRSKIYSLENYNADSLIVDVKEYLSTIDSEFNELMEFQKIASLHKHSDSYRNAIEDKIKETQTFIKTVITSKIDNILSQIDSAINALINETISRQNDAIKAKRKLEEDQNTMSSTFVWKSLLEVTKLASVFLNVLGPVGSAAGAAVSAGVTIVDNAFLKDPEEIHDNLPALPEAASKSVSAIETVLKDKKKVFEEQLADLEKEVKNSTDENFKDVKEKISKTKDIYYSQIANKSVLDPNSMENINNLRTEVVDFLEDKKNQSQSSKSTPYDKHINRLAKMQNVLKVGQASFECYKNIRNEGAKLQNISDAIQKQEQNLQKLEKFEEDVYKIIVPICKDVRKYSDETQNKLKAQSHAGLDVSKWEVQSTLRNLKLKFEEYTKGFNVQKDFATLMENLNEGINTMIILYDRIQDYKDKVELGTYIEKINSYNYDDIDDVKLRREVDKLKIFIHMNVVLERYTKVMQAFGRYVYPFASRYLSNFYLPVNDKKENTTAILVQEAKVTIDHLQKKLRLNIAELPKEQTEIMSNINYTSSDPDVGPFFVWNYDEHKHEFSNLLAGHEILLKSDIKKGLKKDAVKFKQIAVRFRMPTASSQKEFDDLIKHYYVIMKHLGNSYYKCNNKIHIIPSNVNVTLIFRMQSSNVNEYGNGNNDILKKNVPVLSPYTMWSIQLKRIDGENSPSFFTDFIDEPMDIELGGIGQHIEPGTVKCDDDMEKYYILDETLPETDGIDVFNEKYLIGLSNPKFFKAIDNNDDETLQRTRRSLNQHQLIEEEENSSFSTSGASNGIKFSCLNNIFNLIGSGLVALKYLNPVNKINQWFDKLDENLDKEDSTMFKNHAPVAMAFVDTQFEHPGFGKISKSFIEDESPIKDKPLYNDFSFCNNNNLLLVDLLIRWKSGVKYEKDKLVMLENLNSESAHNLAYRGYSPKEKSLLY